MYFRSEMYLCRQADAQRVLQNLIEIKCLSPNRHLKMLNRIFQFDTIISMAGWLFWLQRKKKCIYSPNIENLQ